MRSTRPVARPSPQALPHRARWRLDGAAARLGGALAVAALVAGCAAETAETAALDPADYAWCNATETLCTGWRGAGAFPAGETSPVGSWIIPAGQGTLPQPRFIPGEPVVEGEIEDFH